MRIHPRSCIFERKKFILAVWMAFIFFCLSAAIALKIFWHVCQPVTIKIATNFICILFLTRSTFYYYYYQFSILEHVKLEISFIASECVQYIENS